MLIDLEILTGFVADVSELRLVSSHKKPTASGSISSASSSGSVDGDCLCSSMRLGDAAALRLATGGGMRLVLTLQLREDAVELLGAVLSEDKRQLQMAGFVARNPKFRQR